MSLFHSENPKEAQHKGILGAFSVDNIKWEPGDESGAQILSHRFEYEDFPNGSILTVGPSQMAVFTNHLTKADSSSYSDEGEAQVAVFIGPATIKLETGDLRFAPFRNIVHALTGGESAYHSTVYFINTTVRNDLPWGTQNPIQVEDPIEEVNVHLRANGFFGVHIEKDDYSLAAISARKFIQKVVGTMQDYTQQDFLKFSRAKILEYVPTLLGKSMDEKQIGVLKMAAHLEEFSVAIEEKLAGYFEEYGIKLDHFSFTNTNVPDEDLRAINEMKQARKRKRYEAEMMEIESKALAEKRAREGYTYQDEKTFGVMEAAASNEGSSANIMGAGMGIGMGFGVGHAFENVMGNMANQSVVSASTSQLFQNGTGTGTLICPNCKADNPNGAKFCLSCGYKFETIVKKLCPNCNKELVPGAKFCFECGAKIGQTVCAICGKELVSGAKFCLECGTRV